MAYEKETLEKSILDISERLLFRYGYKNLNLNDVAKEAKISKTTLYKTFDNKYVIASKVIERFLQKADLEILELLQKELPLQDKIRQSIKVISNLYIKMDKDFLYDLENSLPELWSKIDDVRKTKESILAELLLKEQRNGSVREDIDPALLSALIMILVRGIYNPDFFFTHNVSADTAGDVIISIFLNGILQN
ncbi:TPA: TetR/AcrR family transcriptional regulator [Clostridioides difficile]|nr:TetR/AcrR family transcriptional regulator [Clostridioides difficile]